MDDSYVEIFYDDEGDIIIRQTSDPIFNEKGINIIVDEMCFDIEQAKELVESIQAAIDEIEERDNE